MDSYIESKIIRQPKHFDKIDPRKLNKKDFNNYIKKNCCGQSEIKFIDKSYLEDFKIFLKNEIDNFEPNKDSGEFNNLIKALWHQYIFKNVEDDKYYDFVKILNENVKN